jgi:hypothetical protein
MEFENRIPAMRIPPGESLVGSSLLTQKGLAGMQKEKSALQAVIFHNLSDTKIFIMRILRKAFGQIKGETFMPKIGYFPPKIGHFHAKNTLFWH